MKTNYLILCLVNLLSFFSTYAQCDTYGLTIEPLSNEKFSTAEYTLWIPKGVEKVQRIILHQHGCGKWAQDAGRNATDDLHWRLLAQKTKSALLGSSLWPEEECREWCDPENGTERAYLQALDELSEISGHPEIATVKWIVWGHSGGGYWTQSMLQKYPERLEAVILQSAGFRERDMAGTPMNSDSYPKNVPILIHTGIEEKGHERFDGTYKDAILFFDSMRANGAPATLAIDPASGHNAGNSRYLTIPWISAIIEGSQATGTVSPSAYSEQGIWFPNEIIAAKWDAFSKLGTVPDDSAPNSPPFNLIGKKTYRGIELTWNAVSDWESGIKTFRIYRNDKLLQPYTAPVRPIDKADFTENFREPNSMDTPNAPLSQMIYNDTLTKEGVTYKYQVSMVNWAGLESSKSEPIHIKSP